MCLTHHSIGKWETDEVIIQERSVSNHSALLDLTLLRWTSLCSAGHHSAPLDLVTPKHVACMHVAASPQRFSQRQPRPRAV